MAVSEHLPGNLGTTLHLPWEQLPSPAAHAADRPAYAAAKRLMDVAIVLAALVLLAPLLLLIALLISLDSAGPVLFAQERIGFDRRSRKPCPFRFYKFRSMQHNSDEGIHRAYVSKLIRQNVGILPGCKSLKMPHDPRITRVGHILRKTSLDELPQLFNVLKGDMTLVGPRPPLPYEVAEYKEWHKQRLAVVPGVTGWWQVKGRNRVCFDEAMTMDIYYVEHRSLWLDLEILALTPWAVLTGKGAG